MLLYTIYQAKYLNHFRSVKWSVYEGVCTYCSGTITGYLITVILVLLVVKQTTNCKAVILLVVLYQSVKKLYILSPS